MKLSESLKQDDLDALIYFAKTKEIKKFWTKAKNINTMRSLSYHKNSMFGFKDQILNICKECNGKGQIFSTFYYGNGYECSKCGGKGLE